MVKIIFKVVVIKEITIKYAIINYLFWFAIYMDYIVKKSYSANMKDDFDSLSYRQIKDIDYDYFFHRIPVDDSIICEAHRDELIKILDETIDEFADNLPNYSDILKEIDTQPDDYPLYYRTIVSVSFHITMIITDCLVATKHFLIAEKGYDKRFMRGKLRVILNEGFKKIYGFKKKNDTPQEWYQIKDIVVYFPEIIKQQYQEISNSLQKHAISSSWWKQERDSEIHFEIEKLYEYRREEIDESLVIEETFMLLGSLLAVIQFLANVNTCFLNSLLDRYRSGELRN